MHADARQSILDCSTVTVVADLRVPLASENSDRLRPSN
jgi:hypothetical protein